MSRIRFSTRIATSMILGAARLVPRSFRARWKEEWLAEISVAPEGAPVVRRATGALRDAWTCRRLIAAKNAPERVLLEGRGLVADVRYGLRTLARSPSFTLAAVASIALGVAATTTVFSVLNAMLFRTLPGVHESSRLVNVWTIAPWLAGRASPEGAFERYRELLTSLSDVAASGATSVAVGDASESSISRAVFVSDNYFATLGTIPHTGRLIDASVYQQPVAVVSHEFAVREFGGVTKAIDGPLSVNGQSLQVIGVTPPWFAGVHPGDFGGDSSARPHIWLPLSMRDRIVAPRTSLADRPMVTSSVEWLEIIGRVRRDVSVASAQAQAASVPPQTLIAGHPTRVAVYAIGRGPHELPSDVATTVVLFLSIPAIVLAIGCANVANLQLARAAHRQTEVSVRRSLGATRGRIVRLLVVESLLVAALAGIVGIIVSAQLPAAFASLLPVPFPLDWRVLGFAVVVITAAGLGFGVVPALGATREDLSTPLKDLGSSPKYRRSRLRTGLVVAQIALSILLLVMAGLSARSLQRLNGLEAERALAHVGAANINLGFMKYTDAQVQAFREELVARTERLPGVTSAAIVPFVPFSGSSGLRYKTLEEARPDRYQYAPGGAPLGRFVETAGLRIVEGRNFTDADRGGRPAVAVVSQSLARQLAPSGDVLGRRLIVGDGEMPNTEVAIVGVVADMKFRVPTRETKALLLPSPLNHDATFSLWIRTVGDPTTSLAGIRTIVRELEPKLPVETGTAESWRARTVGPLRWLASGLSAAGLMALALAAAGLYAVVSYLVAHRQHEMAIRLALGATPRQLAWLVVGDGFRVSVPGIVIGLLLSIAAAQLGRAMLVGVSPFDPIAFLGVAAVLIVVAAAASIVPAIRTARIDPLATLRRH